MRVPLGGHVASQGSEHRVDARREPWCGPGVAVGDLAKRLPEEGDQVGQVEGQRAQGEGDAGPPGIERSARPAASGVERRRRERSGELRVGDHSRVRWAEALSPCRWGQHTEPGGALPEGGEEGAIGGMAQLGSQRQDVEQGVLVGEALGGLAEEISDPGEDPAVPGRVQIQALSVDRQVEVGVDQEAKARALAGREVAEDRRRALRHRCGRSVRVQGDGDQRGRLARAAQLAMTVRRL